MAISGKGGARFSAGLETIRANTQGDQGTVLDMDKHVERARLETEAIVVGYAMSRLDDAYLLARSCGSWREAFAQAGAALRVPPSSLKNLRDEFDPFYANKRAGWHQRPLRPNRLRVLTELQEVSEPALIALVERILARDQDAIVEAVDSLVAPPRLVWNVAERLLTGRRAEEFFLTNSLRVLNIRLEDIIDLRQAARGFDFGAHSLPNLAVEVKGMKGATGGILFTDREWCEARSRRSDYCLVVVGNLASEPVSKVIYDPCSSLEVACQHQQVVSATWHAKVTV